MPERGTKTWRLFDIMKLPHFWITQALGAREAAERLWAGHHDPRSEREEELYTCMGSPFYTSALFFAGIEIELYLKSMIICGIDLNAEEHEWSAKIFKPSHKLDELCKMTEIELSTKERDTCKRLSVYIRWMGRYPISKKEMEYCRRDIDDQRKLWDEYLDIREKFLETSERRCDAATIERLAKHYVRKR